MRFYEKEYIELKTNIAEMGIIAANMNHDAIKSLVSANTELAIETIKKDKEVDQLDIQIEELCMKILALFEPKAIDLRYILSASRIIVDLERIGDYCVNICKEVIRLSKPGNELPIKPFAEIQTMSNISTAMTRDVIKAYFDQDIELANRIIEEDDTIDKLHDQILTDLIIQQSEQVVAVEGILRLMVICRSLERIADHAVNIAEMVHFMVTGVNIRHNHELGNSNE
jgi:phosphate transport system protein